MPTSAEMRILRSVNPFVAAILQSPLGRMLSGRLLLLTYAGRTSGRRYTVPLGYTREGDELVIFSSHKWQRSLRGGAQVSVYLRGRWQTAHAEVIEERADVLRAAEHIVATLGPKEAQSRIPLVVFEGDRKRPRRLPLESSPPPSREEMALALEGVAVVRLRLETRDPGG
jgi:hypothetical protein